jgi:hypothetical protein
MAEAQAPQEAEEEPSHRPRRSGLQRLNNRRQIHLSRLVGATKRESALTAQEEQQFATNVKHLVPSKVNVEIDVDKLHPSPYRMRVRAYEKKKQRQE